MVANFTICIYMQLELPEHQKLHHSGLAIKSEPVESISVADVKPSIDYLNTLSANHISSDPLEESIDRPNAGKMVEVSFSTEDSGINSFEGSKVIEVGEKEEEESKAAAKFSCSRCSCRFSSAKLLQEHLAIHRKVSCLWRCNTNLFLAFD